MFIKNVVATTLQTSFIAYSKDTRTLDILPPFIKASTQNKLIRNILIVIGGTAGAQLITLLASPIITRLYSPEAIGMLGSFVAVLTILLPLAAFSYPMAIVLPKKNNDAVKIANISLRIVIIFSFINLIVLFLYRERLSMFLSLAYSDTLFFVISLPCAVLISTFLAICNQWVIRHKLFKLSSQVVIVQSLILNSLKVALGLFAPFGKTLIILSIIGASVHSLLLFLMIKYKEKKTLWIPITCHFNKEVAEEYKAFPKYRCPQGLLVNVNQNMPVLLLASLFGPIPAGLYTLCRGTLLIPITLIAKSVNDVLFPQINEIYINAKVISPLIIKATWSLALLALPPLIVIVIAGPDIFAFVFGQDWAKAGSLSQWLALWFYFSFINRACVAAIPVLRLERFLLVNSILNFLLSALGFYLGYSLFADYIHAIALYSLFGIIPQILIISFVIYTAKKHDRQLMTRTNS